MQGKWWRWINLLNFGETWEKDDRTTRNAMDGKCEQAIKS